MRLDRSLRDAQNFRDFLDRQALLVFEDDRLTELHAELAKRICEGRGQRPAFRFGLRRRGRVVVGRAGVATGQKRIKRGRRDSPLSKIVDRDVVENPENQDENRRSGSKVPRLAKALTKASCASSSANARSPTSLAATFTAAEAYLPTRAPKAACDPASA